MCRIDIKHTSQPCEENSFSFKYAKRKKRIKKRRQCGEMPKLTSICDIREKHNEKKTNRAKKNECEKKIECENQRRMGRRGREKKTNKKRGNTNK